MNRFVFTKKILGLQWKWIRGPYQIIYKSA